MGQAQVCCDESQEIRSPQVATFFAFLPSPTTRSHFATMQSGFFDRLKRSFRERIAFVTKISLNVSLFLLLCLLILPVLTLIADMLILIMIV